MKSKTMTTSKTKATSDRMIDKTTAAKLATAATNASKWLAARDALIFQAHEAGASLRDIAAHAGITHVGVMKVINRAAGRRKGAAS